jgi:hypothetical protein
VARAGVDLDVEEWSVEENVSGVVEGQSCSA